MRAAGKQISRIISIGGGAKNASWLQMQADIFNTEVVRLENEQGPAMGAAMLAAVGCGWFNSLEACASTFVKTAVRYHPHSSNVATYEKIYHLYTTVYTSTQAINHELHAFR
jgi:xylulokinase